MRNSTFLLIAGLCLLAACKNGAAQKVDLDEMAKHTPGLNAGADGFEIETPVGWTKRDTTISGVKQAMWFAPTTNHGFRAFVGISTQDMNGISADEFFETTLDFMSKNMHQNPGDRGVKTVLGVGAHWVRYKSLVKTNVVAQVMYFIPVAGVSYMIDCVCLDGDFEKYQPEFDQMINSFKVH